MPAAKYFGTDGGYHNNIPARDLTEDEYNALTDDQKELVKASALYEVKPEPAKHSASRPAAAPAVAVPAKPVEPKDEVKK